MKRTMKIGGGRSITFEDGDGNKVYESLDAWKAEGERRLGADVRKWKFKCPMCGHVAAVEDFIKLKVKDPANSAYEECIGRYTGKGSPKEGDSSGCNWAPMDCLEYQRAACSYLPARSRELTYLILQRRMSDGQFGCDV